MIDLPALLEVGRRSSATIGIGLDSAGYSQLVSVLDGSARGVKLERFEDAGRLVQAVRDERLDAGVRGTLPSKDVLAQLRGAYDVDGILRTAIMETAAANSFMLTPVGIDEGRTIEERLDLVIKTIGFLGPTGWRIRVGVLSRGRPEDADRGEEIGRSLREAEELARTLVQKGIDATHYGILIEKATRECDLLVAPDGTSGNLIFRTLHFLGSGKAYGAPVVNLPAVFVDTSRAKMDFSESVLLAAGLSELGCGRPGRA